MRSATSRIYGISSCPGQHTHPSHVASRAGMSIRVHSTTLAAQPLRAYQFEILLAGRVCVRLTDS